MTEPCPICERPYEGDYVIHVLTDEEHGRRRQAELERPVRVRRGGRPKGSRSPFRKRTVVALEEAGARLDCGHLRHLAVQVGVGVATNCYDCGREADR